MTVTVYDLEQLVSFIDSAAERGAIKGSELSRIGEIRDKLKVFVDTARIEKENEEAKPELLTEG